MKSTYSREALNPDMPALLLLSHGQLSLGLLNTGSLIMGELENVFACSLEEGDDTDVFGNMVEEILQDCGQQTIVLLDLYGGSPCNQMLKIMMRSGKRWTTVSGMSLPMLLMTLQLRDAGLEIITAEDILEQTAEGCINVAKMLDQF